MAEYQAEALYAVAGKLQGKVHRIVLRSVLSYMFLGAAIGVGVWLGMWLFGHRLLEPFLQKAPWLKTFPWWTAIPAIALLLAWEGYTQGRRKSLDLQFEAQRTLCWVKIEEHLEQLVQLLSDSAEKQKQKSD